jgi:hypothetical protein
MNAALETNPTAAPGISAGGTDAHVPPHTTEHARVRFKWKDYRRQGQARYGVMTLDAHEFIRRFLLHVLPNGFHRIRHYGLFANTARADNAAKARALLADAAQHQRKTQRRIIQRRLSQPRPHHVLVAADA